MAALPLDDRIRTACTCSSTTSRLRRFSFATWRALGRRHEQGSAGWGAEGREHRRHPGAGLLDALGRADDSAVSVLVPQRRDFDAGVAYYGSGCGQSAAAAAGAY